MRGTEKEYSSHEKAPDLIHCPLAVFMIHSLSLDGARARPAALVRSCVTANLHAGGPKALQLYCCLARRTLSAYAAHQCLSLSDSPARRRELTLHVATTSLVEHWPVDTSNFTSGRRVCCDDAARSKMRRNCRCRPMAPTHRALAVM